MFNVDYVQATGRLKLSNIVGFWVYCGETTERIRLVFGLDWIGLNWIGLGSCVVLDGVWVPEKQG